MGSFRNTDTGRKATQFVADVAEHLRDVFGVEASKENAVGPPPKDQEGYVSWVRDGAVAVIDVPLSKFISDNSLTAASESLPESVRNAIEAHMNHTYRHHLEVACQGDDEAAAVTEGWDWNAGLPYDKLDEAGLGDLVMEATNDAELDFDVETLRFNVQAMAGHALREAELSIVVQANTEFEHHMSDGAMRANLGRENAGPPNDHMIVDVDFSKVSDVSDAKFAALLDVVKQSFPAREAPAYGMGR